MPRGSAPVLWLVFENEASTCPACTSPRITLLDAFKIPRDARGRRVAFLAGCEECGLVFANPLPRPEELQRHYADEGTYIAARTRLAKEKASTSSVGAPEKRDVLFEALSPYVPVRAPRPGAKVLDFGCGDGKYLDRLQDRGWETYGIEPSANAAFRRHRWLEAPPQDQSFDLAIVHHVLEHVSQPLDVLRQLAATLREGGVLFVGVPRLDTLPQHGDFKYCIDGRNHLVGFTDTCLRGLLGRAGLTVAARLDAPELDDALRVRRSLRLRVVATRTAAVSTPPGAPLVPAIEALTQYARARERLGGRIRRLLPVRVRAALLDRAIERKARDRRRKKLKQAASPGS